MEGPWHCAMISHMRLAISISCALFAQLVLTGCGGHVIRPEFAPNFGRFDFANPPCQPSAQPVLEADEVGLRYLGAGGLYVEWQGNALLMAPFFTNPGLGQILFSPLESDPLAVREGLRGMNLSHVRAIAAGHSHYDHLGDLPVVAKEYVPEVPVFVNRTGANALAPVLPNRTRILEEQDGWIYLKDSQGNDLPIRFQKVESQHAPHVWGILLGGGQIPKPWTEAWDQRHFLSLKAGKVFAFVIDLMSPAEPGKTAFRIYYQDSANPPDKGLPKMEDPVGFDLAVLCMASHQFVDNHPGAILGDVKARHVLVTHYESFFRDRDRPFRFVPFLTNRSANGFLGKTREALQGLETAGPEGTVCGPSSQGWTMPMPGEWVRFKVHASAN